MWLFLIGRFGGFRYFARAEAENSVQCADPAAVRPLHADAMNVSLDYLVGRDRVNEQPSDYGNAQTLELTIPVAIKPGQKIIARIVGGKGEADRKSREKT